MKNCASYIGNVGTDVVKLANFEMRARKFVTYRLGTSPKCAGCP